jgi:hypothetical protein
MGPVFEECAIRYLWRETAKGKYDYKTIGRWWGSNLKEKREEEIDILALDGKGNALFGECKWRNARTGIEVLEGLVRKAALFPKINKKQYILFSKSNFSTQLVKTAAGRKDTVLIDLADMF